MTIKWQEPPTAYRGTRDWAAIFDALRERPNEWALIAEGVSASTAGQIKNGAYRNSQPGEFDARSVVEGGITNIYARYVGGDSA